MKLDDFVKTVRDGGFLLVGVPKRKGPHVRRVIKLFEQEGQLWSPSGMSITIIGLWLKANERDFTVEYRASQKCFSITSPSVVAKCPKCGEPDGPDHECPPAAIQEVMP